jgi:hypothetical protein
LEDKKIITAKKKSTQVRQEFKVAAPIKLLTVKRKFFLPQVLKYWSYHVSGLIYSAYARQLHFD